MLQMPEYLSHPDPLPSFKESPKVERLGGGRRLQHKTVFMDAAIAASNGEEGGNCIKIGLSGKSILRDYFQENGTFQRPVILLRISFPGGPVFIQFVPGEEQFVTPRWQNVRNRR